MNANGKANPTEEPSGSHGLITHGRDSLVGRLTDRRKLNGQVYTPPSLAEQMLEHLAWPDDGGVLLDPACGDGVFLAAALRKLVAGHGATQEAATIARSRLVGWELDPETAALCRERLREQAEQLGLAGSDSPPVHETNALLAEPPSGLSCVLGNPPYLEAKRMPDALKQLIRQRCPLAAHGSFDLYTAFLERALDWSSATGEVCLLIPNRFLVVRYARKLRQRILAEYDVQVLDLSRQGRVFEGAAVYPVVLHLRPPRRAEGPSYRALEPGQRTETASLPNCLLSEQLDTVMPVMPRAAGGRSLIKRLIEQVDKRKPSKKHATALVPLGELVEIRWTVSFHRAKLREQFVAEKPQTDWRLPQRFLGGGRFQGNREVEPFRITWAGYWMDYDEERARAEDNAFPPAALFAKEKLVVCQNARRLRAAVDREGFILKDTFLALLPRQRARSAGLLEWLCIVLNSRLMHYLYEHLYAGTRKQGGYLHYLSRYLAPLPVPAVPPRETQNIRALYDALAQQDCDAVAQAEQLIHEAYGVSRKEAEALNSYTYPEEGQKAADA